MSEQDTTSMRAGGGKPRGPLSFAQWGAWNNPAGSNF